MSEEQTEATIQWRVLTCEDPHTYRVIPVKKGHSLEDVRKFVEQNWRTALNPNDFVFSWKEENIAKELEPFVKVYELASKHADGLKIVEGSNPIIMPEEQQIEATIEWRVLTCKDTCTNQVVSVKKGHSLEDVRKFVEQNWCTTLIPDAFIFSWKGEKIGKKIEPFVNVYELASRNAEGLQIVEFNEYEDDDSMFPFTLTPYVDGWGLWNQGLVFV